MPSTPYTDLYGRHYRGGHIGFLPLVRAGGVPASGFYTIRVKAAAVGRLHDYEAALDDFRNGDPIVMEVAAVDRRGSVESSGNVSDMTPLACIELTNEQPRWFEWTVFIEAGYEPEIRFRNGPMAAKRLVRMLRTKASHRKELKPFIRDRECTGAVAFIASGIRRTPAQGVGNQSGRSTHEDMAARWSSCGVWGLESK